MNENTSDESVQNSEFPDQNSEVPIDKELKAQPIIVNVSPTPVNVNIPQFDDTEDAKANQIAKWGILINLLATVMTLFALFFTSSYFWHSC